MATTAHGITYPDDYNEPANAPAALEAMALTVESALTAMDAALAGVLATLDAVSPLGVALPYDGLVIPSGFVVCDGSLHGSAALEAAIGSPRTPDLRNRFIAGAGGAYALNATGGADTVRLTSSQSGIAPHTHAGSAAPETQTHKHPADPPPTTSSTVTVTGAVISSSGAGPTGEETGAEVAGSGVQYITSGEGDGAGGTPLTVALDPHSHVTNIGSFNTGNNDATHDHAVTVAANGAQDAASAHENRPPYMALWLIMRAP